MFVDQNDSRPYCHLLHFLYGNRIPSLITMEGLSDEHTVQVIEIPMTLEHLGPKGYEGNIALISALRVPSPYFEMKRVNVVRSRTFHYISRNAGVTL